MHSWLAKVLASQVATQTALHDHKVETFLPKASGAKFKQLVSTCLKECSVLAILVDQENKLSFSVTPKFHCWLWHMGARAYFLNLRKGDAMLDDATWVRARTWWLHAPAALRRIGCGPNLSSGTLGETTCL